MALAFDLLPGEAGNVVARLVGWVGFLFFGLCLGVVVWRLFVSRGAVVTITSEGLTDIRVAKGLIPWREIERVNVWEYQRQKAIVLKLNPGIEEKLGLSRMTQWSRALKRSLGADGMCIASSGLAISHDGLLGEICARAVAAQKIPSIGADGTSVPNNGGQRI